MATGDTPVVSVIIPAFNEERYIGECIESVRRQKNVSVEIIAVDDGSTDETGMVLRELEAEDLVALRIENSGAGVARNVGLSCANGSFISFLDADDFYQDDDALSWMVRACSANGTSVCASYRCEMRDGVVNDAGMFRELGRLSREGAVLDFSNYQFDFFFQSYIFERAFIERHHLRFPAYRRYEDPPFLLRALDAASKFAIAPVTLHCYRKGHQDRLENGKHVCDSLKGVYDNLLFSLERGYGQMAKTSLGRCEAMFKKDILTHPDLETVSMIKLINDIGLKAGLITENLPVVDELAKKMSL
ncbi:MAG: glycosyltransferase [Eggerthellaceae bacterium]|nr:glycosyltransferase [Eggerthellaceae bacterium]MBQ9067860.1 glycosyltransferase [Eggerthellaceae bacterium]